MRGQFQGKWARLPSSALNINSKQQLQDYLQKARIAQDTDRQTEERFAVHGESLKLLNKTKNELSQMIPQSADKKDIGSNPVIVTIKNALEELDGLR